MSANTPTVEAEHRIELPTDAVDAIADQLAASEAVTPEAAREFAFDHVDRRTEFVTEAGEPLVEAVRDSGSTGE